MEFIDIIIGMVLVLFVVSGYRSGFVKKLIGIVCLVLALIVATKFSADVNELLFAGIGISGQTGFFLSFTVIVLAITFAQSVLYRVLIKDMVDALWNKLLGTVMGLFEGAMMISIALIIMSIYLNIPSIETRLNSQLYKPLKNFSPRVFDEVNTLFPESQDFYYTVMNLVYDEMKKMETK